MCANYQPVTRMDRLLTYFGVERKAGDVSPPEIWPLGMAPFIRPHEDGSPGVGLDGGDIGDDRAVQSSRELWRKVARLVRVRQDDSRRCERRNRRLQRLRVPVGCVHSERGRLQRHDLRDGCTRQFRGSGLHVSTG